MTRAELIAALEKLEGPSREMDLEIARIQDTVVLRHNRETGSNYEYTHHLYTSSIDSALTLVPPNADWDCGHLYDDHYRADVMVKVSDGFVNYYARSKAAPAIALCIATLKAQESTNEEA